MTTRLRLLGLVALLLALTTACKPPDPKTVCVDDAKRVRIAAQAYHDKPMLGHGHYASSINILVTTKLLTKAPTDVIYMGSDQTYSLAWQIQCAALPGIPNP